MIGSVRLRWLWLGLSDIERKTALQQWTIVILALAQEALTALATGVHEVCLPAAPRLWGMINARLRSPGSKAKRSRLFALQSS
jgi:hypothetical protein